MRIAMPYGSEYLHAELDWADVIAELDIVDAPELTDLNATLRAGLENPIGLSGGLAGTIAPRETVTIVVSDSFRHTGSEAFVPILVEALNEHGIPDAAISLLFATGTHRAPTPEERARILSPALYERFADRAYAHDPHDESALRTVGVTSRGTVVRINKKAVETDRLIVTGSIVFHYFGGFGGGRKALVPGLAGVATISHNHAMNLDPHEDRLNPSVRIGLLDGNPVAEDMAEAASFIKTDLLVNTVLNRQGRIAGIFVGGLHEAHRAGCELARQLFARPITQKADLVIASSGAAKNYVQSHKALYNAFQAMKPGGRVVFVARCDEGLGGEQFAKWIRLGSRDAIIAGLRRQSEINGQTALSTLEKAACTVFVTQMSAEQVSLMGGRKARSLDEALRLCRDELGRLMSRPSAYLMPSASYTVPFIH